MVEGALYANLLEMARKAGTTKPTTAAQGQKGKAK